MSDVEPATAGPQLCVATAADQCGRADLEDAIAHARERAAALQVRQTVRVQRTPGVGVYCRILSIGGRP